MTNTYIFVKLDLPVQDLPKYHETSTIQMSFVSRQLYGVHGPVGNVLLQVGFVPFYVKTTYFGEDHGRVAFPRPTFELPSLK